jgi:hypothetical protein
MSQHDNLMRRAMRAINDGDADPPVGMPPLTFEQISSRG